MPAPVGIWPSAPGSSSSSVDLTAIGTNVLPDTNLAYDIGSAVYRWNDAFINTLDVSTDFYVSSAGVVTHGTSIYAKIGGTGGTTQWYLTKDTARFGRKFTPLIAQGITTGGYGICLYDPNSGNAHTTTPVCGIYWKAQTTAPTAASKLLEIGFGTTTFANDADLTKLYTFYCDGYGAATTTGSTAIGLRMDNDADAGAGAQQYSPTLELRGRGWKTDATAASQKVGFFLQTRPVQGAANPTGGLWFSQDINDTGTDTDVFAINSDGRIRFVSGVVDTSSAGSAPTHINLPSGATAAQTHWIKVDANGTDVFIAGWTA